MNFLDKLMVLIWKQWLIEKRNPCKSGSEISLPIGMSLILLLINTHYTTTFYEDAVFEPFETGIGNWSFRNTTELIFCPSNQGVEALVKQTASLIGIRTVKSFRDRDSMELYVQDVIVQEQLFAAIQFNGLSKVNVYALPKRLSVSLRFPEFHIEEGFNLTWRTDTLYPPIGSPPRDPDDNIGPSPYYQGRGFLMLQEALSLSFVRQYKSTEEFPKILLQRYPRPSWRRRDIYASETTAFTALHFIFLSFIFMFTGVIKLVSLEKETQIKQVLETVGVPNWVLWAAHFVRSFVLFLLCFAVLIFALNVPPGQSLITHSNNLVIFLFLLCFASACITLAFLVSITNSSTIQATTVGAIVWFIFFLPFYKLEMNIFGGATSYVFAPLTFFHGFDLIITYELNKKGVNWNNLWEYPTPTHPFCFAHILITLSIDALVYLLLALYIEALCSGTITMPKFIRKRLRRNNEVVNEHNAVAFDIKQEQPPSNLPLSVQMRNVCKIHAKGIKALESVSLDLYEDQITVLLGPNAAGKTTTANVLVGIVKPTRGTVKLHNSDVLKLLGEDQTYIGFCPQTDILFDELTVEENLYFFSRIKGFRSINSMEEVDKYVDILQLTQKARTEVNYLTQGMKRRLSIAVALCARSKFVVLDEATAGVDPISRRDIWNMLDLEKRGRTILITTHNMDEAEVLGERIAIISEGVIRCCGSSAYLKQEFAEGYRLVIMKGRDCSTIRVTHFMQRHIVDIKVASDVGAQLCFVLENRYSSLFETMLQDLEENQHRLAIQSFRISLPTLEDAFITTTRDRYTIPFDEIQERPVKFLEGRKLFFNKILALFLKTSLVYKKRWSLIALHVAFVLVLVTATLYSTFKQQTVNMPPLKITLRKYRKPFSLVTGSNEYKASYENILHENDGEIIYTDNIPEKVFNSMKDERPFVLYHYVVGASFLETKMIGWYSNFPYHSAPLALNLLINAAIRKYLSSDYSIAITNHPLRMTKLQQALRADITVYDALQYVMAVFSAMFIIFVIREATANTLYQQFICGISPKTYWLTTLLWDIMVYFLVTIIVVVILVAMSDTGSDYLGYSCELFMVLMCYGFHSIHLCYLLGRLFRATTTGYITKILIAIVGIMGATILYSADPRIDVSERTLYLLSILPTFALAYSLLNLHDLQDTRRACTMLFDSCTKYADSNTCQGMVKELLSKHDHCNRSKHGSCHGSHFSLTRYGVAGFLISMTVFGLLFCCVNIFLDTSFLASTLNVFFKRKFRQILDEDEDVIREREWLRNASAKDISQRTVVLKDLCKTYQRFIALNRVSLAVNPYDCFGLIGAHGAGKTTLFKILSGETWMFSGEVTIGGMKLPKNLNRIRTITMYCPQIDGLFINLTGEENLILFALMRGVPYNRTKEVACVTAQKLDFWRHLKKEVRHYSGGTKRKLSAAIALVGNAKIIFLDEPSTGMDISTCKHLWAATCSERDKGKSILISTHYMDECEAVCTRVGILARGKLVCIGSIERLTSKFTEGYILTVRGKRESGTDFHETLMNFMKTKLPTAVLTESFKEHLTFNIRPVPSLSWSKVFHIIEQNKRSLQIEDYTLSQSSLEQVFLTVS